MTTQNTHTVRKAVLSWLGRIVILVAFFIATQSAIRWAMRPGYWMGSCIQSGDETTLELAKSRFGPVLLVHHWLDDPGGTWGTKDEVMQNRGYFETATRLRVIAWTLSGIACILLIIVIKRRTQQPNSCD